MKWLLAAGTIIVCFEIIIILWQIILISQQQVSNHKYKEEVKKRIDNFENTVIKDVQDLIIQNKNLISTIKPTFKD